MLGSNGDWYPPGFPCAGPLGLTWAGCYACAASSCDSSRQGASSLFFPFFCNATRHIGREHKSSDTLVACAFNLPLSLFASLLKKITHLYPFSFLLPCRIALWLAHPKRERALPSLLSRALSVAACFTRLVPCAACPGEPSPVLVAMVAVVLARAVVGC